MLRMVIVASAAVVVVSAAVLSLLVGGEEARGQTTVNVDVGDIYFCDPSFANGICETNINAGDTVNWQWVGVELHTVTQCDASFSTCPQAGGFDSGAPTTSGTFSQTFNTAGTFAYQCNVHGSQMRGRINVAAQGTPTATATGGTSSPTTAGAGSPTALPAGTRTAAAVPGTGGPDGGEGTSAWALVVLVGGVLLTAAAVVGMAKLRIR